MGWHDTGQLLYSLGTEGLGVGVRWIQVRRARIRGGCVEKSFGELRV